ncbi:MAG: metallophosphoesterase family protein [Hyphomicrobiales bacterium]
MSFVKTGAASDAFTLIHISDFHLCRPAGAHLSRFLNKRALSYLSWGVRRRREHRVEVLLALVQAVRTMPVGQIAVTGDLTQLSLPAEFEQARHHLQALGRPENVFVVPGNHDALVPTPWDDGYARWSGYLAPDSAGIRSPGVFPTLRIRGPVALIGVSTARPTRPLSAAGSIGAEQLARCGEILSDTARRGLYRVLLIHHPPLQNAVSRHKRLTDLERFCLLIRQHGAELIIHGHAHRRSRAELPGPVARVPVLGISSASAVSQDPLHRAVFRVFRISQTPTGWSTTCQDHAYEHRSGRFIPEPETVL